MIKWNEPDTLDLNVRKKMITDAENKTYKVVIGCTILSVISLLPTIINPDSIMFIFALFVPIYIIVAILSLKNNGTRVKAYKEGRFFWRNDNVYRRTSGGRYSSPRIYGMPTIDGDTPVYSPANLIWRYREGDEIMCISFYTAGMNTLDKVGLGYRPIAYLSSLIK